MTDTELNEAVARKLGWVLCSSSHVGFGSPGKDQLRHWCKEGLAAHYLPAYSTSIEAAWEIVKKLQSEGLTLSLSWCTVGNHFEWILKIMGKDFVSEWADTAPMAICKAFLKIKEPL